MILSSGLVVGVGCAGVKQNPGSGSGGNNNTGKGGNTGNGGGVVTGTGGTPQNLPVTPISGSFSCTDFDTSGACVTFDTGTESQFGNNSGGSATTIAYPLDGALFPGNLGPIQVQMTTPGTSARITLKTGSSSNVNVQFFGACESTPGNGCSVTLPVKFTTMLIPACQTEDIQITASVLSGSSPTPDSAPINVAWAQSGLTGGLYYWTVVPSPPHKNDTGDIPTPPNYILLDPPTSTNPNPSGTQIMRYDFSNDNPTPQVVWTDDGGPGSTPPYDGAPQSWVGGSAGGHCIGCHTITNDGKYMALTIGGSSTTNAANWELLDIQNQVLELINPTGSGLPDTNSDPSATPTNDPANYWKSYRNEGYAAETSWGPMGDVMVSMFNSKLYFNTVAVNGTSATVTRQGPLFSTSLANVSGDPYQSDPFWSHDGSTFVFTSFNQSSPNGGTNGDLKLGGQIGIATATTEKVNDDAKILVSRGNNQSSYYPCVSEDSQYVVFNTSICGSGNDPSPLGGGYGVGSCDGYDDASAELWWVPAGGGPTTRLARANGDVNNNGQSYSNSWPRFSPDVGYFRGETLYWIAFSSRRPYGVQANAGGLSTSQPQLWFTGVSSGEINVGDPSHSPVWLPGQNPMGNAMLQGNHVPQWVKIAIVIN